MPCKIHTSSCLLLIHTLVHPSQYCLFRLAIALQHLRERIFHATSYLILSTGELKRETFREDVDVGKRPWISLALKLPLYVLQKFSIYNKTETNTYLFQLDKIRLHPTENVASQRRHYSITWGSHEHRQETESTSAQIIPLKSLGLKCNLLVAAPGKKSETEEPIKTGFSV